jgi:hypothetical protein
MKPPIFFGGVEITEKAATSHFMVVGSTGSGKTLNLRMMMGTTLPSVLDEKEDCRGVVFDVKQDMLSILHGILRVSLAGGVPWEKLPTAKQEEYNALAASQIITLNPFDARCYEWNMATDVKSPETAFQVATILIPEEKGSQNRYFSDAARDLLAGVITCFSERADYKNQGRPWGLSDVLFAMRSKDRIREVLNNSEEGKELIHLHMDMERTSDNIISTARAFLAPMQVPAALWYQAGKAGRLISLTEFLDGRVEQDRKENSKKNFLLVLGNNQKALAPIQAVNRAVFQRLTELILDQQESATRRTWVYLDEVRKLGRLDGLTDLMTNGRSKGACVVLGFQDISGMREVYGKELAAEITSMPASFGILRVSGAETPEWASELFGEQERIDITKSFTRTQSKDGLSEATSENEQLRQRRVYLSSQLRLIPNPRPGETLRGYFFSPFFLDKHRQSATWEGTTTPGLVKAYLHPPSDAFPDMVPWPEDIEKKLTPWTPEDRERLGISKDNTEKPKGVPPTPKGVPPTPKGGIRHA